MSTQEKEMEKLVQGDQDKTEQLEHLKKENGHLFLSLTEQVESWEKTILLGICKKIYIVLCIKNILMFFNIPGYHWL